MSYRCRRKRKFYDPPKDAFSDIPVLLMLFFGFFALLFQGLAIFIKFLIHFVCVIVKMIKNYKIKKEGLRNV